MKRTTTQPNIFFIWRVMGLLSGAKPHPWAEKEPKADTTGSDTRRVGPLAQKEIKIGKTRRITG
ncbi:MAG: hypothetical protein PHF41_12585 [Massilibacteroides sp.]|nr:hypothetical protein [Massilibacteroides sp.]